MAADREREFKVLVNFQIMESLTDVEYGKLKTLFTGPKLIGAGVASNLERLEFPAKLMGLGLLSQTKLGPLKDALVTIKRRDLLPLISDYEVKYGLATATGGSTEAIQKQRRSRHKGEKSTSIVQGTSDGGPNSSGEDGNQTQQDGNTSLHPHNQPFFIHFKWKSDYWIFGGGLLVVVVAITLSFSRPGHFPGGGPPVNHRRLSEECLRGVADRLGSNWMAVGTYLGLKNHEIQNCQSNHPYQVKDQIFEMLDLWNNRESGEGGKLMQLKRALKRAGKSNIIDWLDLQQSPWATLD